MKRKTERIGEKRCGAVKPVIFIILPLIAALIGTALLAAVSFVPQERVRVHSQESYNELSTYHHPWQYMFNIGESSYMMDYYTDSLILMESFYTSDERIDSVLKNYIADSEGHSLEEINAFGRAVGGAEPEKTYERYWSGFRIFVRPMLAVTSYYGILKIVSGVYFLLLLITVIALARKSVPAALCFGAAFAAVNPAIISHSLQFTPCFIMAFLFMLWTLYFPEKTGAIAFCLFGIIAQFFDFYTYPLITLALPLLLLLCIRPAGTKFTKIISSVGAWFYGYVTFWVVKLAAVTLFTDTNGFESGIDAFLRRMWVSDRVADKDTYNPAEALRKIAETADMKVILGFVLLAVVGTVLYLALGKGILSEKLGAFGKCAFLGVTPVIWFVVTAQPVVLHSWFQYRAICVSYAAALIMLWWGVSAVRERVKAKNEKELSAEEN